VDGFVLPPSEEESVFYTAKRAGVRQAHKTGPCIQEVKMIERFSEIVQSGALDQRLPKDAVDTVRVCCALAESAQNGCVVALSQ
jgi:hypothetical protein